MLDASEMTACRVAPVYECVCVCVCGVCVCVVCVR
jgi:hypothetical protein